MSRRKFQEILTEGKCLAVVTIDELLEKYRSAEMPERDKGAKFERLMKNFLMTNPVYREKFSDVWLWNEFLFRDELGTVDLGIDIVCKAIDGEFWAAQCKFYSETSIIDKAAVDTFLATSSKTFDGDKKFSCTNITHSKIIFDMFNALIKIKKDVLNVKTPRGSKNFMIQSVNAAQSPPPPNRSNKLLSNSTTNFSG